MDRKEMAQLRHLVAFLVPILFFVAVWVLQREIRTIHYQDVLRGVSSIPALSILIAILLTAANYLVMTGYDALAFRWIQNSLSYRRIALASFIGYAFSNTLGMSMLAGTSVRYRLYSSWGISTFEVAQTVLFTTLTLWLGLFALGGTTFIFNPVNTTFALGLFLLAVVVLYLVLTHFGRKKSIQLFGCNVVLPSSKLATAQIVLASLDWALAGAVLFVLLPIESRPSFPFFLSRFLLAQVAGLISQVPGGLGVFETTLVLSMPGSPTGGFLGSLLLFRIIYYIIPLMTASALLGYKEFVQHEKRLRRFSRSIRRFLHHFAPRFLAVTTFLSGTVLLISGATPGVITRLQWLDHFLPLPILEISHFFGGLAGAGLLLLSRGIQRRLDSAYYMTLVLFCAGIVFSFLKGFDYEEALFLTAMLLALLPCRKYFYRKASFFAEPISAAWAAAALLVLAATSWLVFFAYKHVEYSHDLWWQFSLRADAPRSLRAMVGASVLVLVYAASNILLRPRNQVLPPPSQEDLAIAEMLSRKSHRTSAYLSLLGDKAFLFSDTKDAFLIYGVRNSSWVCLGDPVGSEQEAQNLIGRFLQQCDRAGGRPAFYEVEPRRLHLYLDAGLTVLKLGEEARVDLTCFTLDGKERKPMRHIRNKLSKQGFVAEMVPCEQVPELLPCLKKISDAWLLEKNTREKGFSLGFFDENYLTHFPIYVIRNGQEIKAFANVLEGGDREELSVDLMRYLPGESTDLMEYLFLELMFWGNEQGYRWFNLGMAPLAGLGNLPSRSGWNRLGHFLFRYGEHFYNFQGLREYKEKFDPVWEPRYLAYPGRLALPRILTDIASLISRGLKGVVTK